MSKWIRTCQECGNKQEARPPSDYKSEIWKNLKCKKCGSEALDFGKDDNADYTCD